jgi:hypothetical protein
MAYSTKQKLAKAKLHNRAEGNPMMNIEVMSDVEISRVVGDAEVQVWLRDGSFRAWFLDDKTLNDVLTVGAEEAVKKLIEIVTETNVGPREAVSSSSQVAAAKLLMEFAGMKPAAKTETTVTSGDLPNDEKKLREYIEANSKKLKAVDND